MGKKSKNIVDPNQIYLEKIKNNQVVEDKYQGAVAVFHMENELKDYTDFSFIHTRRRKAVNLLLSTLILLVGAIFAYFRQSLVMSIVFAVGAILFPLALLLIQKTSTKNRLKTDLEFKNTTHTYVFKPDTFYAETKCGKRSAKAESKYNMMFEVYETKTHFYIYVDKENAFVVNKSSLIQGDLQSVKAILKDNLNKEYKTALGAK